MTDRLPFALEDARSWRETYPTPFYIYDEAGIRKCVTDLYKAFSWNPGFKEYFAVKATPTPAILRLLRSLGCGCDCASVPEIAMSVRCGVSGHNIMFSSNECRESEYRYARDAGAIINLDDLTQLEIMERACGGVPDTVCCRYNPGTFANTNDIMGHQYDSKFGMTRPQLFEALRTLKDKGAKHLGIHAMLASCSLDNGYYAQLARELFSLVLELRKAEIEVEFVDLSGGLGIPYLPWERAVDIFTIGEGVHRVYHDMLRSNGIEMSIFMEMGRYITGPYGYLLTTAIGKKHIYKEYVGVDASASDLMRPAIYGAYHHITVLGKEYAPANTTVDVVGSLCENNDKFAVNRAMPEVENGDILVIQDAGAHGHSMGYNYNGRLRCAELLMHPDRSVEMIRRAETMEDYFATLDVDEDFSAAGRAEAGAE